MQLFSVPRNGALGKTSKSVEAKSLKWAILSWRGCGIWTLTTWLPASRNQGEDQFQLKQFNTCCLEKWTLCKESTSFLYRDYIPSLEDFFEEAIEQEDPEQMVEDEYKYVEYKPGCKLWGQLHGRVKLTKTKEIIVLQFLGTSSRVDLKCSFSFPESLSLMLFLWTWWIIWNFISLLVRLVNNAVWSWKALRLLARKSSHFFTSQATNKPLKDYLQIMIDKTKKDISAASNSEGVRSWNLITAHKFHRLSLQGLFFFAGKQIFSSEFLAKEHWKWEIKNVFQADASAEGDMNTEVNDEEEIKDSPHNSDDQQKDEAGQCCQCVEKYSSWHQWDHSFRVKIKRWGWLHLFRQEHGSPIRRECSADQQKAHLRTVRKAW